MSNQNVHVLWGMWFGIYQVWQSVYMFNVFCPFYTPLLRSIFVWFRIFCTTSRFGRVKNVQLVDSQNLPYLPNGQRLVHKAAIVSFAKTRSASIASNAIHTIERRRLQVVVAAWPCDDLSLDSPKPLYSIPKSNTSTPNDLSKSKG